MSDAPKRLRAIADMLENGSKDQKLLIELMKISRDLAGKRTDDTNIHIESMFGALTRKGVVRIEINNEWVMLDPKEAREQAQFIIEAAHSAEFDEFVFNDMAKRMGLNDDSAGTLLVAFREWRKK